MPAKITLPRLFFRTVCTRKPLYLLSLAAIIALVAWANSAPAAAPSSGTNTVITPALKLAAGTLKLEGTGEAVGADSAAKLLPLWQLLAQLESSGFAAPEEISAVADEIKLNMNATQVKAIEAMSFTEAELGAPTGSSSVKNTSTQAASAVSDPMLSGGMFAGVPPMDAGGPMPSGGSQGTTTSKSLTSSATSDVPAVIRQVIQLLQTKAES